MDQRAQRMLLDAWNDHSIIDALPEDSRPPDLASGYALQQAIMDAMPDERRGYKLAATSQSGQAHIAVDHPLCGNLMASRIVADGELVPMRGNHMAVAEAEFVFRFGTDLAPRAQAYARDEVMAAINELYPGIEIPNSRFRDFTAAGAAQLIADNACAYYFVLGEAVTAPWRDADLSAHAVSVSVDDEHACSGVGADALGDPRIAATWLVNHLSERNVGVRAGDIVTTGVCGRPVPIAPGQRVIADFGEFGRVSVRLGDV